MTIVQLISSAGLYGAEQMLLSLSQALSRAGCRTIVAALEDQRNPPSQITEVASRQGLETQRVPCAGRWDLGAIERIRGLMTQVDADVLHTHGYKSDLYGFAAAWPGRFATVSTCHNWPDKRILMQAYALLDRQVLRRFDAVTTPSTQVAAVLRNSGVAPGRLRVIPNGVETRRFDQGRPTLRRELQCDRLVGCVARLVPAKGGHLLIQAARTILKTFADVTFVFVGAGAARAEWEALAAQLGISAHVVFAGERRDMHDIYASFDVLVLPSLDEAMPMCLLEGLAAGCPVVATDVGDVSKVIASGKTGLLVPAGSVEALADALFRLLNDPAYALSLARQGQAFVKRTASSESMGSAYLSVYEAALKSRSGSPRVAAARVNC